MSDVDTLPADLRLAGLDVVEWHAWADRGRPMPKAARIVVASSQKAAEMSAAEFLNDPEMPGSAAAYVERSGRVWLLAQTDSQGVVSVVLEGAREDERQADAVAVLLSVLESIAFDADVEDAGNVAPESTPITVVEDVAPVEPVDEPAAATKAPAKARKATAKRTAH